MSSKFSAISLFLLANNVVKIIIVWYTKVFHHCPIRNWTDYESKQSFENLPCWKHKYDSECKILRNSIVVGHFTKWIFHLREIDNNKCFLLHKWLILKRKRNSRDGKLDEKLHFVLRNSFRWKRKLFGILNWRYNSTRIFVKFL